MNKEVGSAHNIVWCMLVTKEIRRRTLRLKITSSTNMMEGNCFDFCEFRQIQEEADEGDVCRNHKNARRVEKTRYQDYRILLDSTSGKITQYPFLSCVPERAVCL